MKLRGALGGLNLLIEASDTQESVRLSLESRAELLKAGVTVELEGETSATVLDAVFAAVREAGGELLRVRPQRGAALQGTPGAPPPPDSAPALDIPSGAAPPDARRYLPPETGRTEVLHHGLRAGYRGEFRGSVVVLGDVNPGAELVAGGDVIVMGALRGVVHAGAGGRADAIVYARPIASAQIRIASAVARSANENSMGSMKRQQGAEAELARLQDGVIQIESYHPQRG